MLDRGPSYPTSAPMHPGGYRDTETTLRLPAPDRHGRDMPRRAATPHLSRAAAVGVVLAVAALSLTLTGLLAPEGFVVAFVAVAFCLVGLAAGRADGVAGRGLAGFGLCCGAIALALAVLAATHRVVWPDGRVDEVARWHAWLVAHWPWLDLRG